MKVLESARSVGLSVDRERFEDAVQQEYYSFYLRAYMSPCYP